MTLRHHGSLLLSLLSLVLSLGTILWVGLARNKDAYVDLAQVYNGYRYKTDMEEEYLEVHSDRKKTLDSLMVNLKYLSDELDRSGGAGSNKMGLYEAKRKEFRELQERFGSEEETMLNHYREKIFKKINEGVRDYGREEGYDYIYGAEGSGVLMYTDKKKNLTEVILRYLNERYEGTGAVRKAKPAPQKK